MARKAMSAALTLVITIVVLIVVAMVLITITSSNLGDAGKNTQAQQKSAACDIWKATACAGKAATSTAFTKSGDDTCSCSSCVTGSIKCGGTAAAPATRGGTSVSSDGEFE